MAYSPLTAEGKKFIRFVCRGNGNTLLQGKNKYAFPYTTPPVSTQIWVCNIIDPNDPTKTITTNSQLGEALIYWFDKYGKDFELDANVIAAQAFAESSYIVWNYAGGDSTASGINQFTMQTLYWVIVSNMDLPILPPPLPPKVSVTMTSADIATIIDGLTNPRSKNSYSVKSDLPQDAIHNRPILHQNVINNPGIMIKAQCYYMKYFANKCDSLTSTSLFCYSRGTYMSPTYSRSIQKCDAGHPTALDYKDEGLTYVLKIFGILGDKDNLLEKSGLTRGYKEPGYYFGYDKSKDPTEPTKNLRIGQAWNPYDANVDESKQYNLQNDITETNRDVVVEEFSIYEKYKFIYYPENNYNREQTTKLQLVLHHTASGGNAAGDILWWEHEVARTGTKVATSFILMRDGTILQLFSTYYWAWHLGIEDKLFTQYGTSGINNRTLNSQSIGIEIDNWGGLINSGGNWYPAASPKSAPIPQKDVIEYKPPEWQHGYHGYAAFEKYTDAQITSLRVLISAIVKGNPKISLDYSGDGMWGTYDVGTNKWLADRRAFAQTPGIWTHVSYQPDKSDCQPQPDLKYLLQHLK